MSWRAARQKACFWVKNGLWLRPLRVVWDFSLSGGNFLKMISWRWFFKMVFEDDYFEDVFLKMCYRKRFLKLFLKMNFRIWVLFEYVFWRCFLSMFLKKFVENTFLEMVVLRTLLKVVWRCLFWRCFSKMIVCEDVFLRMIFWRCFDSNFNSSKRIDMFLLFCLLYCIGVEIRKKSRTRFYFKKIFKWWCSIYLSLLFRKKY